MLHVLMGEHGAQEETRHSLLRVLNFFHVADWCLKAFILWISGHLGLHLLELFSDGGVRCHVAFEQR